MLLDVALLLLEFIWDLESGDWILNEFWFLQMEVCILFEGIGHP